MDINDRIAQWEKMAHEAPDDMAWLSLGNAYKEAGRLADADRAFAQAIQLNRGMSRAYELRGQVLIQLDRRVDAAQLLVEGYAVAAKRGDVMPQEAIGKLLKSIDEPIPQVACPSQPVVTPTSADAVIDRLTGQPGSRMPQPPMRGPLGAFIQDHFSQQTWRQWIGQGTKVINELRLDFSNEAHQRIYDEQMKQWLQISDEEVEQHASKAPAQ